MSRNQVSLAQAQTTDPFIIIHNYRHKMEPTDHTQRSKRVPHDYTHERKSIILTRKMKAELEEKGKTENVSQPAEKDKEPSQPIVPNLNNEVVAANVGDEEQNQEFFNKNELEIGIPLSDSQDEDILYNRNQMSMTSTYTKLEKTLFGMTFNSVQKEQEQEQEQQQNQNNISQF